MFSKKNQADIKKSTVKVLDAKKDSSTRLKHLRIILENGDNDEAKQLFEKHYSAIYFAFSDVFENVEVNLKQKIHKQQKDELELVLYIFEKILIFLPELLCRKWQLHSITRVMKKLLHPGNSLKLRKEAIRLFIIWYQILQNEATDEIRCMFATLVPGLPGSNDSILKQSNSDVSSTSTIQEEAVQPLLPSQKEEKQPANITCYFLETLLDYMVSQISKVNWRDLTGKPQISFAFLFEEFQKWFLPGIFPDFISCSNLYVPSLELPEPCLIREWNIVYESGKIVTCSEQQGMCQIAFIKWLVKLTQNVRKSDYKSANDPIVKSSGANPLGGIGNVSLVSHPLYIGQPVGKFPNFNDKDKLISLSDPHIWFGTKETLQIHDIEIVKEVLLSSRKSINFILDTFTQSFYMHFKFANAPRKVVAVYKDWIMMPKDHMPEFLQDPNPSSKDVRGGIQNLLLIFITSSSSIFAMDVADDALLLQEQVEIAKRLLNLYRYIVMNIVLEQQTWEQVLVVLLHIISNVMKASSYRKKENSLGGKMAPGLFQTLIVTWFRANLNVSVAPPLWDKFLSVLSSLTHWEELINEWGKTIATLTRIIAKHVFYLDLQDLPLDRLTEQKAKRRRGFCQSKSISVPGTNPINLSNRSESLGTGGQSSTAESTDSSHANDMKSCVNEENDKEGNSSVKWNMEPRFCLKTSHSDSDLLSSYLKFAQYSDASSQNDANHRAIKRSHSFTSSMCADMKDFLLTHSENSRSPSPLSGQECNSMKDSPIQLDVTGENCANLEDPLEGRPSMAGGNIRGWRPDVAFTLWKRLLGALGNVNHIPDPRIHAQVFRHLNDLCDTLIIIRNNQSVSIDNLNSPAPPTIIPPFHLILPWCFQATLLPSNFMPGILFAHEILIKTFVRNQDYPGTRDYLIQFYRAIHIGLASGNREVFNSIVKLYGPKYFSHNLPGFTLLMLDFLYASDMILSENSKDLPRLEAVQLVASSVMFVNNYPQLNVFRPKTREISVIQYKDAKEIVLSLLLRSGKEEPHTESRCTALNGLGIFIYTELIHNRNNPKISEALNVLLKGIQCTEYHVAQTSCDILQLICTIVPSMLEAEGNLAVNAVETIVKTLLAHLTSNNLLKTKRSSERKNLLLSFIMNLGEWCMSLPLNLLLRKQPDQKSLLFHVFDALDFAQKSDQTQVLATSNSALAKDLHVQLNKLSTVTLAARAVLQHMVNHLNHFPMNDGAAHLGSLVVEQDDVPNLASDDLSSEIFHAPNIQMFMLNNCVLLSLVELPALETLGAGVTAGLVSSHSQVRVILRDLSGKASWDTSILYGSPEILTKNREITTGPNLSCTADQALLSSSSQIHSKSEESLIKGMIRSGHSLKIRGGLPVYNNPGDADSLDDLLQYIGSVSPECLAGSVALNEPALPPCSLSRESEDDLITVLLSQRNNELDYVHHQVVNQIINSVKEVPPSPVKSVSPFFNSRFLFTQLGLANFEKRANIHLLKKSDQLLRELKNLDNQKCRECHKVAVIYVAEGQEDKHSIMSNQGGSRDYEEFVAGLAWEVELETHTGFLGGLQRNRTTGDTAPYYATSFLEVIFHVSTRMPYNSDDASSMVQKLRHLGNDEVHIVWSEHTREYRRGIIPTEFCDVLIVVYPRKNFMYRIQISRKPEIPLFGPLFDGIVVDKKSLPGLVRATAINASRAKRSMLPYYQNFFEERAKALGIVFTDYKDTTTYEEFMASVHCPSQPASLSLGSTRASGTSFVSKFDNSVTTNLAAALLDSQTGNFGSYNSGTNLMRGSNIVTRPFAYSVGAQSKPKFS